MIFNDKLEKNTLKIEVNELEKLLLPLFSYYKLSKQTPRLVANMLYKEGYGKIKDYEEEIISLKAQLHNQEVEYEMEIDSLKRKIKDIE